MHQITTGPARRPGLQDQRWRTATGRVDRLTRAERDVFLWLACASSSQEIAARLGVTERTVRAHLTRIFDKLQVSSRAEACLASFLYGQNIGAHDNVLTTLASSQ